MSNTTSYIDMFYNYANQNNITYVVNVANANTYAFLTNTDNNIGITDRSIFVNTST